MVNNSLNTTFFIIYVSFDCLFIFELVYSTVFYTLNILFLYIKLLLFITINLDYKLRLYKFYIILID